MRPLKIPKELNDHLARMAADQVITELNKPYTLAANAVQRLADMLTAVHTLRMKETRGESIHPDEVKPINEYLARHKWITQLIVAPDAALYFQHEEVLELGELKQQVADAVEQRLASAIVAMASDGTLERIQRCEQCSVWFYGRPRRDPKKGAFHSDECRKQFWRSKPEVQKRLLEYQKKYYRDVLSPVTGWAARKKKRRR